MSLNEKIDNLDSLIMQMAGTVEKNLNYAFDVYLNYDKNKFYKDVDDVKVNAYERWIEAESLNIILSEHLEADELRTVTGILSMVQDLERLGDHALDIMQFALKIQKPSEKEERILNLIKYTNDMVNDAVKAYMTQSVSLAENVISRDDFVDKEYLEIIDDLASKDREHKIDSLYAIYTSLVIKYIERIADHATNISEWVIYILTGFYKDKQII